MLVEENREDFIRALVFQAIECRVTDIYRKRAFCVILSRVSGVKLELPFDITKDIGFFRRFLYFEKLLESVNNIEFLDDDKDPNDIFKFDNVTATSILNVNNYLDGFIGVVSEKLNFGDIKVNYEDG